MIRTPFNWCVIHTTLDLARITNRLESAIYDPHFPVPSTTDVTPKHQSYFGQIRGFKFSATRIIGHKNFHLPIFLSPTIEGQIDSLYHGYEISLEIGLHKITSVLLLTWLGGLVAMIPSVLTNISVDSKNYQSNLAVLTLFHAVLIAYCYFDAWRATKFFKILFAQGFTGIIKREVASQPHWNLGLPLEDLGDVRSSTDLLRKNLPSFPIFPSAKTTKIDIER